VRPNAQDCNENACLAEKKKSMSRTADGAAHGMLNIVASERLELHVTSPRSEQTGRHTSPVWAKMTVVYTQQTRIEKDRIE